jgi:hypothetical protein
MSQGHNYSKVFIERKFVQFLNLFRLNEHKLNDFRKKIDENYLKKSEEERLIDRNNQKKLEELNQEIRSMLMKHEKGLISDEILKLQMNRLNEELINTRNSLNKKTEVIVNILEILEGIEGYLKNPGEFWSNARFDTKIKLQVFEFPKGVIFDGQNFRTLKMNSIFNAYNNIYRSFSFGVDSEDSTYDTPIGSAFAPYNVDWNEVVDDIVKLDKILHEDPP